MASNKPFLGEDISINIAHTRQLTENLCYHFLKRLPEEAGLTSYGSPIIHIDRVLAFIEEIFVTTEITWDRMLWRNPENE